MCFPDLNPCTSRKGVYTNRKGFSSRGTELLPTYPPTPALPHPTSTTTLLRFYPFTLENSLSWETTPSIVYATILKMINLKGKVANQGRPLFRMDLVYRKAIGNVQVVSLVRLVTSKPCASSRHMRNIVLLRSLTGAMTDRVLCHRIYTCCSARNKPIA